MGGAKFDCVERIAKALGDRAGSATIQKLITMASKQPKPMARRNALRVLGQFCWSSSGCRALHGQGCRMNRACAILLVGNEKEKFKAELQERILKETKDKPLDDALWISGTY